MIHLPPSTALSLRGGRALAWGVVAPGEIANDFTSALHAHTDHRVVAVGSRSRERAAAFAARHGIDTVHDTYQSLFADAAVDVVYIAAPNSEHGAVALAAIAAGKHVLVEKPFATSAAEAERVITAARSAGVFAMEAMWSRYLPQAIAVDAILKAGILGEVQLASADVGWVFPFDAASRAWSPELGGGALLDAGVYALWFVQFALGGIIDVAATGSLASTGVDAAASVSVRGPGSRLGWAATSITHTLSGIGRIGGSEARLSFTSHLVFPGGFTVTRGTDRASWHDESGISGRNGLCWQASALATYIAEGRTESPLHSLDQTLELAHAIDIARDDLRAAG